MATLDTESQQVVATAPKRPAGVTRCVSAGVRKNTVVSLLSGPYFPQPPKLRNIAEEADDQPATKTYKEAITHLALNPVDVDGMYGYNDDEIMPLPFDTPKMFDYLVEIATGVYMVAQATIIMFISILVDNDYRSFQLGSSYESQWAPIIKALVILYPLVTLTLLVILTVEYSCRKFMYYRLLSMRVLVDWKNVAFYQGWFFYYFIATWILLNVWSLYGVVQFWDFEDKGYNANTVSFTSWIVVNLQTMQLLLYYKRLLSTEDRLVSLNQVFERDPIEANYLLKFTYVIEEEVLIKECRIFGKTTDKILIHRLGKLFTCGYAYKDWLEHNQSKFDMGRLKRAADNYEDVEQHVRDLKAKVQAKQQRQHQLEPVSEQPPLGSQQPAAAAGAPDHVVSSRQASSVGQLSMSVPHSSAPSELNPCTPAGHANNGGTAEFAVDLKPEDVSLEKDEAEPAAAKLSIWSRISNMFYDAIFSRLYGCIHVLWASVLPHTESWPYRGDMPCFRMLVVIELIGVLCVAAIIVFGLQRAASTNQCDDGNKSCNACETFITKYGGAAGKCASSISIAIQRVLR